MRNNKYAVDSGGFYTHLISPLLDGWEKTELPKQVKGYVTDGPEKLDMGVRWKGSKLPAKLMEQVLGTLRQYPHKETGYVLYYRLSDKTWRIECPEQSGSGGHVEFVGKPVIDGYAEIGTIHTHPDMAAEWSSIDMHDQANKFGLHMVIGTRNGYANKIKCTVFTSIGHYDQDLESVIESIDFNQDYAARSDWVENINKQKALPEPAHGRFPSWPESSRGFGAFDELEDDPWPTHGYGSGWTNWQQRERQAQYPDILNMTMKQSESIRKQIEAAKEAEFSKGYNAGYKKALESVVGNVLGSLVNLDDSTDPATVDPARVDIVRDFLDAHGVQTIDLSDKASPDTTVHQLELMVARLVQWLKHQDSTEAVQTHGKGRKQNSKLKKVRTVVTGLFKKLLGKKI